MVLQRMGIISGWTCLLLLPFVGIGKAVVVGAAILLCGLLWGQVYRLTRQGLIGLDRIRWMDRVPQAPQTLSHTNRTWIAGLGLLAILLIPALLNDYWVDVLTLAGIYIVLALGLNIVVGLAGLLDLGYVAFYAIGAYTYALLSTRLDVSFWAGMPLSGLTAAGFGVVLGLVTLRLRGDYLAIVTLGFIQIVHLILNNWDRLTHGPNGILNIGRPVLGDFEFSLPAHFYYLIVAIGILAFWSVNRLNRSRIGRAWVAIREDEIAAAAMGIPTVRFKVLAFTLGAMWAGIAGSFFAAKFAFISPESFTFIESVLVLCMVVLGGMGSLVGVAIGASILVILPEMLRGLADYRMLIFGALLVLMMVFRPQGLIPSPRRRIEINPGPVDGAPER